MCDNMYANLISGLIKSACLIRPYENLAPRVGELIEPLQISELNQQIEKRLGERKLP